MFNKFRISTSDSMQSSRNVPESLQIGLREVEDINYDRSLRCMQSQQTQPVRTVVKSWLFKVLGDSINQKQRMQLTI